MRRRDLDDAGVAETQIGTDRGFLRGVNGSAACSSPDFTRSRIMARSNSAKTPSIWNIIRPLGVAVSSPC
jgi:hypothetical protein